MKISPNKEKHFTIHKNNKKPLGAGKVAIEELKEQATNLKKRKVDLEQEVKLISYQV